MPDPRTLIHAALPLVSSLEDCADYSKTVAPFMPQLYELPSQMAAHITDPQGLQSLYAQTNPLITSLAFALFLTPVVLTVSEANKNYSQVDRLWSILPVIYNVHYAVWASVNDLPTHRLNHVMAVSIIWGLRLSFNYWRKGGYSVGSEDYRWEIVKAYIGPAPMFILNVVFISLAQNILLWIITAPTYVLLLTSRITGDTVSQYDSLFSKTMLFLVVVEFFADGQQWAYYHARELYRKSAKVPTDKKYTREQLDRGFNTTGLFAWSRHPNFAAEQAFWVCLYQWACLESWTYVNWTGAAAFGYLMLFQSSTWLTELLSSRKYPEYKIYQERVGKFLPKAATKSMDAPATPKEKQKVEAAKNAKPLKGQKKR